MLANLITTILLALGVATGNVSSNSYKGGNAFNNEAEIQKTKPIQKATETQTTQLLFANITEWHDSGYNQEFRKNYLYKQNTDATATVVLDNMIIYNSTYTFEHPANSTYYGTDIRGIYKLINIYPGTTKFNPKFLVFGTGATLRGYNQKAFISTDDSLQEIIDITMNASSFTTVETTINNAEKNKIMDYSGNASGSNYNFDIEIPEITLLENETKYLIFTFYVLSTPTSVTTDTVLSSMEIEAEYIVPTRNYEIIDVPNLMFTILTMPFAWYSTAFNLTIFPNTPYALNFGNLVLTIVAAMTLLYLIRKILH